MRESLNKDKRKSSLRGRGNPGAAAVNNGNRGEQFLFKRNARPEIRIPRDFGDKLDYPVFTTLSAYDPLNDRSIKILKRKLKNYFQIYTN